MTAKIPFSVASGLHIKDDFLANAAVTTGAVGELDWDFTAIANASAVAYVTGATSGGKGVLRDTTATTAAGDGMAYHLFVDGVGLDSGGGYVRARVRYPSIAGNVLAENDFRIGVDDSVTATDPTKGIWVRGNSGVLSLEADSAANGDNSANVANVATLTGGTTMVLGTWHDIEIRWFGSNASSGPDTAELWVDGYLGATVPCQLGPLETMEPKIVHWNADATTADTVELDIDYYELALFR